MANSTSGFDIRRLVAEAVELQPVERAKASHPVGYSVPPNHSFDPGFGQPRIRIPKQSPALERIRDYLAGVQVPSLQPAIRDSALSALLVSPRLIVPLVRPNEEDLLNSGLFVDAGNFDLVRAVGFAVVVRSPKMQMRGSVLVEPPIAGYGRLIALTQAGAPQISVDGVLSITWTTATSAFARGLRDLYTATVRSARAKVAAKRVSLFLGPELSGELDRQGEIRLIEDAAIHKFDLSIIRYEAHRKGLIVNTLRREPPSILIVSNGDLRAHGDLLANFEVGASKGVLVKVSMSDHSDIRSELCEKLCELSRVSSNLLPLEVLAEAASDDQDSENALWPVREPGKKRRHPTFGLLQEDKVDGFWYTKDLAEHGGSRFKRYRLENRTFVHVADIDSLGQTIDGKHKGWVGKHISMGDTHGVEG